MFGWDRSLLKPDTSYYSYEHLQNALIQSNPSGLTPQPSFMSPNSFPHLQHVVKVGDLLSGPASIVISHLKPGLHPLDVGALLEEVLVGAVVLE